MDIYLIALIVFGIILIAYIISGERRFRKLRRDFDDLAECFLRYAANPSGVDIIESYPINKKSNSDINYPNNDGF